MNTQSNPQDEVSSLIEQGHKLVRLEGDQQRQMSIAQPRNERDILARLKNELKISPKFAKKVFYSIPYKNNSTGRVENVRGVSIKGSMAIQRLWGNCASACRVVDEQNDRIICEGVFMDYETNSRVMRQIAVSRFYTPKGKSARVPLRPDKLEIAIASGMSKAVRNAVNNGIPEYFLMEYFEFAIEMAGTHKSETPNSQPQKQTLSDRVKELLEGFAAFDISKDQMLRLSSNFKKGDDGSIQITEAACADLLGALNALEEGHVTKESLLDETVVLEPGQDVKPKDNQDIKLDDLI